MSLQLEFSVEREKFILQLPLDDSLDILDETCQDELGEFFDLIGPLSETDELSIPSQTISKVLLINSIKKIIGKVDNDKSIRVKQYRISCEQFKIANCWRLKGIILKGKTDYYTITQTKNGCILERQVLSEDGTKMVSVDPISLDVGIIETENVGSVCISAKKTKPSLYFRLKKLLTFLNSVKTDSIIVIGDEMGKFVQNDDDIDDEYL
jgi:hypothetical protein